MNRAYETLAAMAVLRRGISSGYWTIEDLDNPPPGAALNYADYRRWLIAQKVNSNAPVYRNLLRQQNVENIQEDDFIL
jgi:hypothetical protein